MNMKVLLAALAAGVASFLLGWLVHGVLLRSYMEAGMTPAAFALHKQMENFNWIGMIIANLAGGTLIAWALSRMGVNTAMGGLVPGAIIGFLIAVMYDMFFYSMMNMYSSKMVVVVDVLANTVSCGMLGAVAGLVLGMGPKTAKA